MIGFGLVLLWVSCISILAVSGTSGSPEFISSRAFAMYHDEEGNDYRTDSDTITISVLAVPAIAITPDNTAPSGAVTPSDHVTRMFRMCNAGNRDDSFLPTRAEVSAPATISNLYYDTDNSGTVTPGDAVIQIGQTLSPVLDSGACQNVLFAIDTNNISPNSQLVSGFTARSTVASPGGGFVQDDGTIIDRVEGGSVFTAPDDPGLPPAKLVENQPRTTAAPGQVLNYSIAFRNRGAGNALQVRVVDDLPVQLEYVPNTLRLNNRSLTDAADQDEGTGAARRIELLIPEVGPDAITQIQFQARLSSANASGNGVVNFAALSAANVAGVNTSNAVVVVDPVGTVFAGNSGGAARVVGARVTLAVDESGTALNLMPDTGYEPNAGNSNPFITTETGGFGFALANDQIGTTGDGVRYVMAVNAPNYRPRLVEVRVRPSATGGLYRAAITPLDGQAIATANGFSLTEETVELNDLAALVFNVPMFELSALEISKSADKQFAEIGDIVSYRVQVKNATASSLHDLTVRDLLPPSFVYAAGTAQIENGSLTRAIEPQVDGNQLTFNLGEVSAGLSPVISYRVRIGASAREGDQINSAVATGTQPNGVAITTPPARAVVKVNGGVFSMRQIVIGRVFEDRNGNGQFDKGERPVVGARVYTNNGQSVITDSAGQYNLPAVDRGSIVIALDPVSMPDGYNLMDDRGRKSSKSWTRLLRTPLGGGSLLRQNFAIAPRRPDLAIPEDEKFVTAKGALAAAVVAQATPDEAPKSADGSAHATPKAPDSPMVNAAASNPTPAKGSSSETFTVATTETIQPMAPGEVVVLSPNAEEVVMSPALSVRARVANDWTIDATINGAKIDSASVGEKRVDNRNQITTYSFVGITLRPGPNELKLTAVDPNGQRGATSVLTVYGRGEVETIEIGQAKTFAHADAAGGVTLEIRAFDRWKNPAADGQVAVETSAGNLIVNRAGNDKTVGTGEISKRQMVSLENGVATLQLVGDGVADSAHVKAMAGRQEAVTDIRFDAELRPTLFVGLAEFSVGRNAPDISSTGDDETSRGRLAFFYRGKVFGDNLLTLAYDSRQALNRVAGRDRVGGFDPIDRSYPVFGDSSTRFEDAQSNSKIYARIDRGHSYVMFGDMLADLDKPALSGYARKLTGGKVHLENEAGDFISVTAARPDTAFARDVIPGGGLSVVRLSHGDILPGSEVVALEVRDRRNPEVIVSRENLIRSVDYNIDPQTGEIFFMRPISTFDYLLNLIQIVVTYEHHGVASSNFVYTGRAVRNFKGLGLRAGVSYINQQQGEVGAFQLGGFDLEKTMPRGGKLNFEAAMSNGRFASGVNVFDFYNAGSGTALTNDAASEHNGTAVKLSLDQPLPFFQSRLKAEFQRSSENFYNPFGATIAPGNQRMTVGLEMHPSGKHAFAIGFEDERNRTSNVDNARQTISALWTEQWRENLRTSLGFDHRHFSDQLTDKVVDSNLVTAAIEYRPTDKFEFSVKREQNLGEADPTYPNQTILAAKYQLNNNAKLFFTQRLASGAITPIADLSSTGFSATKSRRETAFGIETKFSRLGAVNGRYQIENGINGTDSFAVIGLQNRWAINEEVSVEAGFERGFLLNGNGKSFNSVTFGTSYTPNDGFHASARYEMRDRNGLGQQFSIGAAGKIGQNWTTLARGQWSRSKLNGRDGSSSDVMAALAYRPLESDKYALLFSFDHKSIFESGTVLNGIRQAAMRDRSATVSADGMYQVNKDLEVYGRFALRLNGNGNNTSTYASASTFLAQMRVQQRLSDNLDIAAEGRWLTQPASGTRRASLGAELGYWLMSDLRFGLGYNFTGVREPSLNVGGARRKGGFYFTVTSKLSNLFDLFGTSKQGLTGETNDQGSTKAPTK
jgi:uncharacterized repeat protein (TIGR01451 family)